MARDFVFTCDCCEDVWDTRDYVNARLSDRLMPEGWTEIDLTVCGLGRWFGDEKTVLRPKYLLCVDCSRFARNLFMHPREWKLPDQDASPSAGPAGGQPPAGGEPGREA